MGWLDQYKKGGMIKRADGSYSQRGLWDNIRANAGSGKKPTKEMLKQEKKIRAAEKKEYGGWLDEYQQGGKKLSIEGRVNRWLGDPMGKAQKESEIKSDKDGDPLDNIRHVSAGRYTTEAIANKTGNIPYISKPLGVIGANIMGIGHELGTYFTDPRWTDKNWKVSNFDKAKVISRELLEDAYNNFAGSVIGATDMTPAEKTQRIRYLSENYMIPDGYGLVHPYRDNPTFVDPYSKKKHGGYSTTGYKADSPDRNNPYNIIPSGRITMQNVPHPVLGIDNYGNTQYMVPGGEYQFPGETVFEVPAMKEGGIPQRYKTMGFTRVGQKKAGDGQHKWKVLAKKGDSYKVVQGGYRGMQDFKQHHSEERKDRFWDRMGGRDSAKAKDPFSPLYWHKRFGTWEYGGAVEMQDGGDARIVSDNTYVQQPFIPASLPRSVYTGPVMRESSYMSPAYREQLEREYNWKQANQNVVKPLLKGADVVSDVMQVGNFIPHPIAQGIGKVGNVLGTGVDALQAGMDLGDGNYGSAAINAGSMLVPIGLESQAFRRNSKYLRPGQPLYPFSPQAMGSKKRVQYLEPFVYTRHMTPGNLIANRALLGTLAAETAIDTKEYGGWLDQYQDGGAWSPTAAVATNQGIVVPLARRPQEGIPREMTAQEIAELERTENPIRKKIRTFSAQDLVPKSALHPENQLLGVVGDMVAYPVKAINSLTDPQHNYTGTPESNMLQFATDAEAAVPTVLGSMKGIGKGVTKVYNNPQVRNIVDEAVYKTIDKLSDIPANNKYLQPYYKRAAYNVMSQGEAATRELKGLLKAAITKGNYYGNFAHSNPDRDLLKLFIYGDETGFTKNNLKPIGLERYEKKYGPLNSYDLKIVGPDGITPETPNFARYYSQDQIEEINNLIKKEIEKNGIYAETAGTLKKNIASYSSADDISGHMNYIYNTPSGEQQFRIQDIWKFDPDDYAKRWNTDRAKVNPKGSLTARIQSRLIEKAGKPFILSKEYPFSLFKKYGGWLKKYK